MIEYKEKHINVARIPYLLACLEPKKDDPKYIIIKNLLQQFILDSNRSRL